MKTEGVLVTDGPVQIIACQFPEEGTSAAEQVGRSMMSLHAKY